MIKLLIITSFTLFQIISFSTKERTETLNDFQKSNSSNCNPTPLFQSFIDSAKKTDTNCNRAEANCKLTFFNYYSTFSVGTRPKLLGGSQLDFSKCSINNGIRIEEWQFSSTKDASDVLKNVRTFEDKFKGATYARHGKYPHASMQVDKQVYVLIYERGEPLKPNPLPQYLEILKALSSRK